MSYDIYFIKRKDLSSKNIETILESDAIKTDKHYVSKQQMLELKDKLIQQGLKFEVFDNLDDDYLELNFPTYQISMFNNQFAISTPYWNSNNDSDITNEIEIIINTFLDNGFTGYDPQMEEFIVSEYGFKKKFSESNTLANKALNNQTENRFNYKYVGVGIAILIIGIILYKVIN